ncbi:phosphoribosyl-ATP pyrophosphatase /phosphoribosyl-AMP cyclohydrolase [Celerinatantimonas diazotrophica]|uniref:Histidine biosynthesis bifunctional protein HisIE n=2 Tax=Celerinatantimonas diazotrophica TaxID=412034 RepID=A0A4R1JAS2_9GAMM|nr:bifunctional phosphoribosyl-AMP cyclohydrolase/phosphoribosyl-ATP diphosphatase HisIE [Celerinatantimonas diazotrophica]TCK47604.1 phosphoribosyl-ATP pyrophosphatase /phosphoribosyl-AMP cyclohydrolase [Celerinatantimonas diazotrophica]CAG9296773.1 Histidine biosynthesis bifunctional protein HisIE [Celerinatantimonas diazotrophica]
MKKELLEQINWQKVDGLIPAIIQDEHSAQVLMLGYMNPEALMKTLSEGKVTFFSRSKKRLWTKGETSGHFLNLKSIQLDCDNDTLLVVVEPIGPTCHTGTTSCFGNESVTDLGFIAELEAVIASRHNSSPEESYTARLFAAGTKRMAQKVGEEGVETALAATVKDRYELTNESADLLFHLLVLLEDANLPLSEVISCLKARHK